MLARKEYRPRLIWNRATNRPYTIHRLQNRRSYLHPALRFMWRQRKTVQAVLLLILVLGTGVAQVKMTGTVTLSGSVQAMAGGKHSVLLTWSGSQAPDITFRVYRSTSRGRGYQLLQSPSACGRYIDLNVVSSATYYYVITAYNSNTNSESAYSNQVTISIGN
jgi:hypothetical protein